MTVHCPHCTTGYELPDSLVGERGVRVRCPNCGGAFDVRREKSDPAAPPAPGNAEPTDLDRIATEILDTLARALGPALEEARARGLQLSRHGPALLDAYDEYRRRTEGGSSAPFLAALQKRWGLDLPVLGPPGGSTG
jgi:predicted Zn finger-like uncharacterized protein